MLIICAHVHVTGSPAEISRHSYELARIVYVRLSSWRHGNGRHLAELYHGENAFTSSETQGPIVNFNLLRSDGTYIGYTQVTLHFLYSRDYIVTVNKTNALNQRCLQRLLLL